jgi:hypothetical protein
MSKPIYLLPVPTLDRLTALIQQRQQVESLIEVTIQTARETLGVPAGYVIGDIRAGFVAPTDSASTADTPPA